MFSFLSPVAPSTSIELEGNYLPNQKADKGQDETQVFERGGSIGQRVLKNNKQEIAVGARYRELDLSGDSSILRDFYNHQVSFSYKRNLPEDRFWMTTASYGSASDRPFKNHRDNTLTVNYLQKFNPRWFGVVNYSNNRTFLNNVPLPGFFYVHKLSRDEALIAGFPFIYWLKPVGRKLAVRYFGLLPWTHRLKILYKGPKLNPYIGYEQSPQSFFRHDRRSDRDRIFWFERRVSLGVEAKLSKMVSVDAATGWAFDREFYEAKNFSQEKENHIRIDNSYFLAVNLRINL